MTMASGSFGDLLDPRFEQIFQDHLTQLPDKIPSLFSMPNSNGRDNMRWSDVGAITDWDEFDGSVSYEDLVQGYDTVATPLEFVKGTQVARKLFDDDQYHIMDQRPASMATAAQRTRQKHGARIWNNAFSVDTYFYNNSEGVALCSNSHTTNASSVSTSTGFDNLITSALSATAVASARIQMVKFRDDKAGRIDVMPDELLIPVDLYEKAYEIVASQGQVDTAQNNRNVHESSYGIHEWSYLSDTNNWFMQDSSSRKASLFWLDRVTPEFAFVEDFDSLIAKWRGYGRWGNAWIRWHWILGSQVS
jgi:phage major head subunit gpT-like protein